MVNKTYKILKKGFVTPATHRHLYNKMFARYGTKKRYVVYKRKDIDSDDVFDRSGNLVT